MDAAAAVACHNTAGVACGSGGQVFGSHFICADRCVRYSRADHATYPFRATPHSLADRLGHGKQR